MKKLLGKLTAFILAALMAFYAYPVFAETESLVPEEKDAFSSYDEGISEEGEEKDETQYALFEETSMRESNEKHFALSGGEYMAVKYSETVHYKNADGEWLDIDNTITQDKDGYRTSEGRVTYSFADDGDDALVSMKIGEHSLSFSLYESAAGGKSTSKEKEPSADSFKNVKTEIKNPEEKKRSGESITAEEASADVKTNSSIKYTGLLHDTDLEYIIHGESLKENIIINKKQDKYEYSFLLTLDKGLTASLCSDGSIDIKGGDCYLSIPAPYMTDADEKSSTDVEYTLKSVKDGYILTVTADDEWINDDSRAFPVCVDPAIVVRQSGYYTDNAITTGYVATNHAPVTGYGNIFMGYDSSVDGEYRTYAKINSLPAIPKNSEIVRADIQLYQFGQSIVVQNEIKVAAYKVNASFWYNNDNVSPNVLDVENLNTSTMFSYRVWNITGAARSWYNGTSANHGVVFKSYNTTAYGSGNCFKAIMIGANNVGSAAQPAFVVYYRNNMGLEDYFTYQSHSVGRAGEGYIQNHTGQLTFARADASAGSYTLSHVYNSAMSGVHFTNASDGELFHTANFASMLTGHGWKLSAQETVIPVEISGVTYLVYNDSDGTEHFFYYDASSYLYRDEDGLGLDIYDDPSGCYIMADEKYNRRIFRNHILSEIIDSNNNHTYFLYNTTVYTANGTGWYPISGAGNQLRKIIQINSCSSVQIKIAELYYTQSGYLDTITDCGNKETRFVYTCGNLTGIILSDGVVVNYAYYAPENNQNIRPHEMRMCDVYDSESNYGIVYESNQIQCCITRFYEYYNTSNTRILGKTFELTIEPGKSRWRYAGEDNSFNTDDDNTTTYLFDYWGRTVTSITSDNSQNAIGMSSDTYSLNTKPPYSAGNNAKSNNKLKSSAASGSVSENYLICPGFEDSSSLSVWEQYTQSSSGMTSGISCNVVKTGTYSGYLYSDSVTNGSACKYQNICLSAGTYTFSAYVKVTATAIAPSGGARIAVKNGNMFGSLVTSEKIGRVTDSDINGGWERLWVTFTVETQNTFCFEVDLISMNGTVFFDDLQLERGENIGRANLITNGSMELATVSGTPSYWAYAGICSSSTADYMTGSRSLKLTSNQNNTTSAATQQISILRPASTTFILSGCALAESLPEDKEYPRNFELCAKLFYTDGTNESFPAMFNKDVVGQWQYASVPIVASDSSKTISYIVVYLSYEQNANSAYFDNISLIEEAASTYKRDSNGKVETIGQTDAQSINYTYDGADLIGINGMPGGEYTYTYDDGHNVTSASSGGVTQLMQYDGAGNIVNTRITDSASNYIFSNALYSDDKSKVLTVTNQNDLVTNYTYYSNGLPATSTFDDSSGNDITTTYGYYGSNRLAYTDADNAVRTDNTYANGNLSRLLRTGYFNGNNYLQSYDFTYDAWGNNTGVSIGTHGLIQKSYHQTSGNLTDSVYQNGFSSHYTYDKLDRIIGIRYNDNEEYSVEYAYGTDGNLTTMWDHENVRRTDYEYDRTGRLVSYKITSLTDGEVYEHVRYAYDSHGRTTACDYLRGNSYNKAAYTYNLDGTLDNITAPGGYYKIDYSYDYLKRPAYKKYTNSPTLSQGHYKYYYYKELSEIPGISGKRTTTEVSELRYDIFGGEEFAYQYTYDTLGNITETYRVPITNVYGTPQIQSRYTYDSLNQLVMSAEYDSDCTYVYIYDTFGNLRSQRRYSGTGYTSVSAALADNDNLEANYTYGYTISEEWKDLLLTYRGQSITYDNIGNPLNYYNGSSYTFTWTNGRRLATSKKGSETTLSYCYNADGQRIQKGNHAYTYAGDKLVYDKWGTNYLEFRYDESGTPFSFVYNGNLYYYITNVQGDVTEIRSIYGDLLCSYRYSPFGKLIAATDSDGCIITTSSHLAYINPIRYRGYYYDSETGLFYVGSRYYDPEIGRFINADSQLNPQEGMTGFNMFQYCGNNPVNRIDPTGEAWWHWALGAAVVVGFAVATVATAGTFAAGMAAVAAVGSGMAAATTASTVAAAGFIASATYLGVSAMNAASNSKSVSDFNAQGNWGTVGGTLAAGVIGSGTAYVGSKSSSGSTSKSRGSTATKQPSNLREQLALEQVKSNPQGIQIPIKMTDARWPASEGWVKMQQIVPTSQGDINIHYVYNQTIKIFDDFKIK